MKSSTSTKDFEQKYYRLKAAVKRSNRRTKFNLESQNNAVTSLKKLLIEERRRSLDLKFELDIKNGQLKLNALPPFERLVEIVRINFIMITGSEIPEDYYKMRSRKREIATARQMFMYIADKYYNTTLQKIGLFCGGRDHSTVSNAKKVVGDFMFNPNERQVILLHDAVLKALGYDEAQ